MRRYTWQVAFALGLMVLSVGLYALEYWKFHREQEILFYLMQDLAFVPIQVLLVTLVIHGLLERQSKRSMLTKLNMVVGAFFSEVGTALMKSLAGFDRAAGEARGQLLVTGEWTARDFAQAARLWGANPHAIDSSAGDLKALDAFLRDRMDFMLRLLENPNLLEHDTFTELLWAVFHLGEELRARPTLAGLPPADMQHLSGDIRRAYGLLVTEWLEYMKHLQKNYPYLFSLAVRMNPFDEHASAIVQKK